MTSPTLYHGAKNGIVGSIRPESRLFIDFGRGFYMGTQKLQAQSHVVLAAERDKQITPYLYTLNLNEQVFQSCTKLKLDGLEWACFVLFNRGYITEKNCPIIHKFFTHINSSYDFIIGPIADDAMNVILPDFAESNLSSTALLNCMRALNYGTQYVAKTIKACSCIEELKKEKIVGQQRDKLKDIAFRNLKLGREQAEMLKNQFRRDGKYFDELLKSNFDILDFKRYGLTDFDINENTHSPASEYLKKALNLLEKLPKTTEQHQRGSR